MDCMVVKAQRAVCVVEAVHQSDAGRLPVADEVGRNKPEAVILDIPAPKVTYSYNRTIEQ